MQGVPAHIETLKSDGRRRHPSYCIFAQGKGTNRMCNNSKCPMYCGRCKSAAKCDYYKERGE